MDGPWPQDSHAPMPKWRDEVQAAMHPVVLDVLAVKTTLITEILLKLLVHVVGDRLPAVDRGRMRRSCEGGRADAGEGWLSLGRDYLSLSQTFLTTQSC